MILLNDAQVSRLRLAYGFVGEIKSLRPKDSAVIISATPSLPHVAVTRRCNYGNRPAEQFASSIHVRAPAFTRAASFDMPISLL